jgi:hypothetical protein
MDNNDYYYYKYLKYKQKYEVLKNDIEGGWWLTTQETKDETKRKSNEVRKISNIFIDIDKTVNYTDLITLILEIMRNKPFNIKYQFHKTVHINNIDNTMLLDNIVLQLQESLNQKNISHMTNRYGEIRQILLDDPLGNIMIGTNMQINVHVFCIYVNKNDYDPEKFFKTYLPNPTKIARLFFDFDKTLVSVFTNGGYDNEMLKKITTDEKKHIVKILTTPHYNDYTIYKDFYVITRGSHKLVANFLYNCFKEENIAGKIINITHLNKLNSNNFGNISEFKIEYKLKNVTYIKTINVYGSNNNDELQNAEGLYKKFYTRFKFINERNTYFKKFDDTQFPFLSYENIIKKEHTIDINTYVWAYIKTLFIANVVWNKGTNINNEVTHNIFFDDNYLNIQIANKIINSNDSSKKLYGVPVENNFNSQSNVENLNVLSFYMMKVQS